jgi:cystathionine gamma-lyase
MVWVESPTNPLLKVMDIKAISEICKQHPDIILVVDNTFLTSYFQVKNKNFKWFANFF